MFLAQSGSLLQQIVFPIFLIWFVGLTLVLIRNDIEIIWKIATFFRFCILLLSIFSRTERSLRKIVQILSFRDLKLALRDTKSDLLFSVIPLADRSGSYVLHSLSTFGEYDRKNFGGSYLGLLDLLFCVSPVYRADRYFSPK